MTQRALRPIAWDIYEEHLDEAAFLWTRWEDALCAANYALHDVAVGPESRLLAHLDGLVLGGKPVVERLLLPALTADEPERASAAAWVLVQAEHGEDHQDAVIHAWLNAEPSIRAAIGRALEVSPKLDLNRVARAWSAASTPVRAAIFEIMSLREPGWARPQLEAAVRADDSQLVAAGLRMLRRLGDRTLVAHAEDVLRRDVGPATQEAIYTGVVFGLKRAWDTCRQAEIGADCASRMRLALLAVSPNEADRNIVRTAANQPSVRRNALWALGFAGDRSAADLLVDAMSDEKAAKVAGEAFAAITGIALEGPLTKRGKTQGPGVDEMSDDDPPPIVRSEDNLPMPNAEAVARWWKRERARFPQGVRHCYGAPRNQASLRAALLGAPTWRREVLWLELASNGSAPPAVNLRAWAHEQTRVLGGSGR
jgi:uncharacterized protein (TIGR02270 family)